MARSVSKRMVSVLNLGRMGFVPAYDVQNRYARMHLDELAGKQAALGRDTILLVEHNPVYTTGLRSDKYSESEELRLKSLGAEFYRTNRGGLITFHGPGQLVAYPILNLRHFTPSMKWYISTLQETIIHTCRRFGIQAHTTSDSGVWVENNKIAAIGVHGSRFITTHGMALNCNPDLAWFKQVTPCGLVGKGVTSVSRELYQEVAISDIINPFLDAFEKEFDCQIEYTLLEKHEVDEVVAESPVLTRIQEDPAHHAQVIRQMSTQAKKHAQRKVPMW